MMSLVGYLLKDLDFFNLFAENSQIIIKIHFIPILLPFIYLVKALVFTNILNDVTVAPFTVSFLQLAAEKKATKTVQLWHH